MIAILLLALPFAPRTAAPAATHELERAAEVPAEIAQTLTLRAPGAAVEMQLDLADFQADEGALRQLKKKYADFALLFGYTHAKQVTLSVLAGRTDGEPKTSAQWRERILASTIVGAGVFDVGSTACSEHTKDAGAEHRNVSFHAFLTAGEWCFDLHVFFVEELGKSPMTRDGFKSLVESARFAIVRHGNWNDLPGKTIGTMHQALLRGPAAEAWLRERFAEIARDAAERPENAELANHGSIELARAEIIANAHVAGPEGARARLQAYDEAIAHLARLVNPARADAFAHALALDGRALALVDLDRAKEAIEPLIQAIAIVASVAPHARGTMTYDLARAQAHAKEPALALQALTQALELEPKLRERATKDRAFESLRADKAFQEVVALPKAAK